MLRFLFIATLLLLPGYEAKAWDRTGHRISAELAFSALDNSTLELILALLEHHPRYQQDFIAAMPRGVRRGSQAQQQIWLLGQAAFWPDLARGLPVAERDRYNRSNWHYIDGAWIRDATTIQGNVYINHRQLPDIEGRASETILVESDADNIILALDYNAVQLLDPLVGVAEKAIALCWIFHLIGDIHQPLHAGSMFSQVLQNGDAGGNGVETDDGSLHRRWDSALSPGNYREKLELVQHQATVLSQDRSFMISTDWSQWLQESRELLQSSTVYSAQIREEVEKADRNDRILAAVTLDFYYIDTMTSTAQYQIAKSALRLANWFNTHEEQIGFQ